MHKIFISVVIYIGLILPFTNFFYEEDDWYILKNPGQIQCFTDDNYRVIVGSINGIFSIDKISKEVTYAVSLVNGLPSKDIKNILYDRSTNYIWVVHEYGLSYKSLSSFSYSHISFSELIEKGMSSIDDIGISSSYIWLRRSNYILPLNPFSGSFININNVGDEMDEIKWQGSMFGYGGQNIDISGYYSNDPNWSIGYRLNNTNNKYIDYNILFDKNGNQIIPTLTYIDSEDNFWMGTDLGFLYFSWRSSRKLEIVDPGLKHGIVSGAIIDEDNNWWIFDSNYKRTGHLNKNPVMFTLRDSDVFLTFWNETDGIWKKFPVDKATNINDVNVNDVLKVGNYLFIATIQGLCRLDLGNLSYSHPNTPYISSSWSIVNSSNGLYDTAVWKIVEYGEVLFILTSEGINEIDIKSFSVIPSRLSKYSNIDIYDMIINGDDIILSTANGIASIDLNNLSETFIDLSICNQLQIDDHYLYCLDRGIIRFNLKESKNPETLVVDNNIRNFRIFDNYLWLNLINRARLIDLNNGESWYYAESDGITGNEIFNIGGEEDWIWFIADTGISIYNWKKYHE